MDPGILIAAAASTAESSVTGLFVLIVIAMFAVFGGISGAVASSRGHGFWPFFFLGALISPLLAIILVFIIAPPKRAKARWKSRRTIPMRSTGRTGARGTGSRGTGARGRSATASYSSRR